MKLVIADLNALEVGGRLVYSTYSIASEENDEVIWGVLRRIQPESAVDVVSSVPLIDDGVTKGGGGVVKMEYGWMLIPDDNVNWGPLYVAVLEKQMALVDMKKRRNNSKGEGMLAQ
jgi:16S rRNA C967 or C1407 C5-methylase (RsmB/RsmF family)